MKKIVLFFLIIFSIFSILINMASLTYVSANVIDEVRVYKIYDENSNLLFERDEVELGDNYLSKDFKYYEVISLDKERMIGIARFSEYLRYIPLKADQARKTLDDLANANYQD